MFQKPAFGANTSFGMQSSFGAAATNAASPFGGFKPAAGASTFGAPPAFGAATTAQPATGGGLFGSPSTTGGLFGASTSAAPAPAFGAAAGGFGFGASTSAGAGGLFGNNTTSGLFGATQTNNAFGAKPPSFGFGGTTTNANQSAGLFGNTTTAGSGLFGQQNNTMGGGGLFSATQPGAFGQQQQAAGTAHVKYNPVVGTDTVVKSGTTQTINIKHHCITCMKEYESKSLEELRLEDYAAGRKGQAGGMFGFSQPQQENKSMFGGTPSFGQPATTSAPSMFGAGAASTGGFGQTNTFSFGGNTQASTNTTGLFGGNKPAFGATNTAGTGLFGAAATTQAPAFGTNTSTFGFGSNLQNNTTGGGLFGAKPATSVFGATPANSGFGAGGGLFGAKPLQTQAPTFGAAQPGIGTQAMGFGANTSTSGGLFGGNAFGKPATAAPSFGFGTAQPTLGLGGNTFQANKTATPGFGALGGSTMFQQPNANTSFRTDGGLGGGMFGNSSALGGGALGLGMNTNNSSFLNNNLSGASAAGNVHEQILTLTARPYGDSPLFKDLLPDSSTTAEDVLRPTNPAAMKAVLDRSQTSAYRVTSPTGIRLKLQPRTALAHEKKSLFDGLEESDATLEDKLRLRPSRKRLNLRPKPGVDSHNDSADASLAGTSYRSREDEPQSQELSASAALDKENTPTDRVDNVEQVKRNISFPDNNNLSSSDRQGRWLESSKLPWSDKERPIDNEPTPRIYPNLDKELPAEGPDRRASWLTTKTLRKPLAANPEAAETSVRELAVRSVSQMSERELAGRSASRPSLSPHTHENVDTLSGMPRAELVQLGRHLRSEHCDCAACETIAQRIELCIHVSEEDYVAPRDAPPHPTGVKLTRAGYYCIPSLDEMIGFMRPDGSCVVPHLTIGRTNYGNVYYDSPTDVAGLDLDSLVHFLNKEVTVYPEESDKPPLGEALNKRAVVTLDRIWPRDKTEKRPITDPDRLMKMDYEGKLRRVCDKHDTKFIEYRPQTGSWVFRVEHFSKYGLNDSDDEDEVTPEVLKRQLANQSLQTSAAPAAGKPPLAVASPGLGVPGAGLGGLGAGLGGLGGNDSIFAMQQASLNLLNGASRAFDMDTTEDTAETQSLYQDTSRAYGVKSPTSELARLEHRQSHHVQLMKASLYTDTEIEDDISISTGDQLVPMSAPLMSVAETIASLPRAAERTEDDDDVTSIAPVDTEEAQMRPLTVRPHTVVLKYHRKVPPFLDTIAGRLDASYIGDMSVARARHSRVGFGNNGALVYTTSYDSIADLPRTAELSSLGKYVRGRERDDWSERVVARLALGQIDEQYNIQEVLGRHLDTLFEFSTFRDTAEDVCPRLQLAESPRERRAALQRLMRDAQATRTSRQRFGVTGAYCYEVWKLCDALWGADLDNDGVPGTDDLSIVNRHRKLLEWMTSCVADVTDDELSRPRKGEDEDESDGHSARVWTLLLGGRVLEACRVAKEHGDLNLATVIAQAAGDLTFRSLIRRQLSVWRECGADTLVAAHRLAILQLVAGEPPREHLARADWRHALHATARYLCPQVPSLEQIIREYESLFSPSKDDEAVDLTALPDDEMGMQFPLPPYSSECGLVACDNGKQRRVLDLRYELLRARAFNARPRLRPALYSRDPLDYSLCFVLGVWFGNPSAADIAGAAHQLEACGAWHRAVQALCYHPDDAARGHLIRAVLSRHAPAKVDTPELKSRLELVNKLKLPEKWLLLAQAHRAKYEHLPALEAEYLAGAGQWNAAHRVLLEELLPEMVLSDNLASISPLLDKMNDAAARHELSGWASGGQALHHYLHVCNEVRGLVCSAEAGAERAGVPARLEALRPAVAAACRALAPLQPTTPRHAAARAEMGARLVQLAMAAGEPPHQLAALLKALRLPPDCTASALHKITTDLAEHASELCIESASSSPISSHHRATAAS